jgi:methionine aminopeptidase
VVTADRSLSAHFEHTIAITHSGLEILTCTEPPDLTQWGLTALRAV